MKLKIQIGEVKPDGRSELGRSALARAFHVDKGKTVGYNLRPTVLKFDFGTVPETLTTSGFGDRLMAGHQVLVLRI